MFGNDSYIIESEQDVTFRSRLNELDPELKCEIAAVTLQYGWNNPRRREGVIEALDKFKAPYTIIGTGTNRFIIKYDDYVIKIALDREGVADNKQEWNIGYTLPSLIQGVPDVALPYEISIGGHLLVADYAPAFTSFSEMNRHHDDIRKILNNWYKQGYLLGDVGIQEKNYANWGLFKNRPVCIDYAYIYRVAGSIFGCTRCGSPTLNISNTFSHYTCNKCKHEFPDALLRSQIDEEYRQKLFNDSIRDEVCLKMMNGETTKSVHMMVEERKFRNPDEPNINSVFFNVHV